MGFAYNHSEGVYKMVYITTVILTVYKMMPIISPPTSPTYV